MTGLSHSTFPFFHQHCQRGRGEQLCVRGDAEPGVGVHQRGLAHAAEAIAFSQDHLPVLHDSDRKAGHGKGLHDSLDVRVKTRRRLLGGRLEPEWR